MRLAKPRQLEIAEACPGCGAADEERLGHTVIGADDFGAAVGLVDAGDVLHYELCRQCGLVFLDPRYAEDTLDHFYSDVCPVNEEVILPPDREVNPRYARREATRWRLLRRLVRRHAGKVASVVDLGALDGASLVPFAEDGAHVIAIEPGWEERKPAHPAIVAFSSLAEFERSGEQVDCVISTQTFEHLRFPGDALRGAARVVRPGGAVVVEVPYDLLSMRALLVDGSDATVTFGHCEHINFFSRISLERMARSAGLDVVRSMSMVQIHKYGGLIPSLTLIARVGPGPAAPGEAEPVTRDDLADELRREWTRIRVLQRRHQIPNVLRGLGRW